MERRRGEKVNLVDFHQDAYRCPIFGNPYLAHTLVEYFTKLREELDKVSLLTQFRNLFDQLLAPKTGTGILQKLARGATNEWLRQHPNTTRFPRESLTRVIFNDGNAVMDAVVVSILHRNKLSGLRMADPDKFQNLR